MRNYNKRKDKGAALIIVLFTLVIVSVFMSLMYAVSRKQILSETREQQASMYSQYLRTTLDIIISPIIMGDYNNTINNDFGISPQGLNFNNTIIVNNVTGNILNGYTFNLYYTIGNNNLWSLNRVTIQRRIINGALTIIPTYDITINTIVAQLNNTPNDNFDTIVRNLGNDKIRYSGRALATVVQRTPYNISTNTALFVKHPMMWVPFAADPFIALSSVNNIDKCIGITNGYNVKGDLSTPNLNPNDLNNAFRNVNNSSALNTSGLTGVWDGTKAGRLISGGSNTGYARTFVNQNSLSSADDFSIKTYKTKKVDNNTGTGGINEGKLPGTDNNGNINLNQINSGNIVRINITSNNAILVGSDNNGNITRRPQSGGLIEMVWPTDNNNNFMPNNDTSKAIVNSYPPKYATVYIVPDGTNLRIFAVGGYSKQRVNVNTLLSNINNLPTNGRTVNPTNNEIIIDLNRLSNAERNSLAAIHVNGGNVVVMPNGSNNNGLYYYPNNNTNNQPQPFQLTVVSTRFTNTNTNTTTDNIINRSFYRDGQGSGNDLGGWNIPNNFNPNNGSITLADRERGINGATYIVPDTSNSKWDNRRQVVRALEGNTIIQNFRDNDFDFRKANNESIGFVGYSNNNGNYQRSFTDNSGRTINFKPINVVSQNYVVLNYQDNSINNYYLSANIITTRGSLTIPDRDIYRWLMDDGRFNTREWEDQNNGFQRYIIKDKTLTWYGKYLANFGSVEGVANPTNPNEIFGFSQVNMTASDNSDLGNSMPPINRQDWYINFNNKRIILYDIVKFEINK
jgi:hypothetical protein